MLCIRCAQILTPTRAIPGGAILVDGGKITACGPIGEIALPPGAALLDAPGSTACPGFIDWQVNGGYGVDFSRDPAGIWEVAARLPETGVTSFLPTIITSPPEVTEESLRILRSHSPHKLRGARPLGFHFEGPFLNPEKKGAHNPDHIRAATLEETRGWSRRNGVWVVTLAPEMPGADQVMRSLAQKGVVVSAGHSSATYEQAAGFLDGPVRAGTHLFNAQPRLEHRSPGLSAALLLDRRIVVGLIPDGIHVHPAMVQLAWRMKGRARVAIVTDCMAALGMPPGRYPLAGKEIVVDGSTARLQDGTLAGSILRMDQAVANMLEFTGCTLQDAVRTATLNTARLLRLPGKGRVAPGADADLVLLDEAHQVEATIIAGEVRYLNPAASSLTLH